MLTRPLATRALVTLEAGESGRVAAIADDDLLALADVGIHEGSRIRVERRLPLGGPVIVEAGRARISVARPVGARTRIDVLR